MSALNIAGDSEVLPTIGLGARFQKNKHGFDISANFSSLIFTNYASLKGLFLFYPYPEKKNQFYLGVGPGIGYHLNFVPMGSPYGTASDSRGSVTLEGVLGYEFRHSKHLKTFIQLEISHHWI